MNYENKIKVQGDLIKQLREENSRLLATNNSLMAKIDADMKLVTEAIIAKSEYEKYQEELDILKNQNRMILEQFKKLKAAYGKQLSNEFK